MVSDLGRESVVAVTRDGYPEYGMYGHFSPDGNYVAYSWRVGEHFDLRLASVNGGQPKTVVAGVEESYMVRDWSADGKSVLAKTANALVSVSIADGSVHSVVDFSTGAFGETAQLSPDDRLVAYDLSRSVNGPADIRLFSLLERKPLKGIQHPAHDSLLGWSPDGRWILFISDREGEHGLWASPVSADGAGAPLRIHHSLGKARPFAMGVTRDGSPVYTVRTWQNSVHVADYDPDNNTILTTTRVNEDVDYGSGPSWSPDGGSLAYARHPELLVVHSLPSGHQRVFDVGLRRYHDRWPHWIGDQRLLVSARPSNTAGFVAVDVTAGKVVPVVSGADKRGIEEGTASTAGKFYFPSFQRSGDGVIVERDVKTGSERVIHRFRAVERDRRAVRHLALSADRKSLCFVQRTRVANSVVDSLSVITVAGGDPRTVLTAGSRREAVYPPAWTPDGNFLLVGIGQSSEPDSELEMVRVNVVSGEMARVGGGVYSGKNMGGLSIHPSGRKLAFTLGEITAESAYTWSEVRDEVRMVDGVADWLELKER